MVGGGVSRSISNAHRGGAVSVGEIGLGGGIGEGEGVGTASVCAMLQRLKDDGAWAERWDDRCDAALVEAEETEVNDEVGEASFEPDRFVVNFGMEERFLMGVDAGDEGTDNEDCFGEPDPWGGVVSSNEVSTRVSCKLSSGVVREPLEEEEDELNGRDSWRYISSDSPARDDIWSDATSERAELRHC